MPLRFLFCLHRTDLNVSHMAGETLIFKDLYHIKQISWEGKFFYMIFKKNDLKNLYELYFRKINVFPTFFPNGG